MNLPPNKTLLRLHRYLGLIAAPLILFFAVSGVWQVYRLQQDKKDGSYKAPKTLRAASDVHMAEKLKKGPATSVFRFVVSAASAVLVFATILGMIVGVRLTRPRWLAVLLLVAGGALPVLLYVIARS
jgi:hypothetical protein